MATFSALGQHSRITCRAGPHDIVFIEIDGEPLAGGEGE